MTLEELFVSLLEFPPFWGVLLIIVLLVTLFWNAERRVRRDVTAIVLVFLVALGVRVWNHADHPGLVQNPDGWFILTVASRCDPWSSICDPKLVPGMMTAPWLITRISRVLLDAGIPLEVVAGWSSPVIAAIASVVVYGIARGSGLSWWAALASGIFAACSPIFHARTQLWFFDTDAGNVLLMGLIAGAVLVAERRPLAGWTAAIAGMVAFSQWWVGSTWFFGVLVAFLVLRSRRAGIWKWPLCLGSGAILAVAVYQTGLWRRLRNLAVTSRGHAEHFIAELRPPGDRDFYLFLCGSPIPFFLALVGFTKIPSKWARHLFAVWGLLGLMTSFFGVRFFELAVIPFAIAFGAAVEWCVRPSWRSSRWLSRGVAMVAVLLLFVYPWVADPVIRYTWTDVDRIKRLGDYQSPGLIVAWWQDGSFLSYWSGRPVLGTAVNQGSDQVREVARALCAWDRDDLDLAREILDNVTGGEPWIFYEQEELRGLQENGMGSWEASWRSVGGCQR